ncbi:hypothetical protein SNE40_020641 [Patella caerulea]|uniref:Uncharacterized protein n=1 Tax=Patella caerulea TaxID=87958 RepID=A0AAN8J5T8_PATCE
MLRCLTCLLYTLLFTQISSETHGESTDLRSTTACNGVKARCTRHHLSCPETSVISIVKVTLGYKHGCTALTGIMGCFNIDCCRKEFRDCTLTLEEHEYRKVSRKCSNMEHCGIAGIKSEKRCKAFRTNAYSTIEYRCTKPVYKDNSREVTTSPVYNSSGSDNHTLAVNLSLFNTDFSAVILGGLTVVISVSIILVVAYCLRRININRMTEIYPSLSISDTRHGTHTYHRTINSHTSGPEHTGNIYIKYPIRHSVPTSCDHKTLEQRVTTV